MLPSPPEVVPVTRAEFAGFCFCALWLHLHSIQEIGAWRPACRRSSLPQVVADPSGLGGREQALYAAYLSAAAFASAGSGLHHKICHVLGGACNLPHAQTHAVVLPYVLAFNGPAAPEAERRIAAAFGANRAIDGLHDLRRELAAPRALRDYGFTEDAIPEAADAILPAVPPGNPRPVTAEDLRRLLRAAWSGADPREGT